MSERTDLQFLADILESAEAASDFVTGISLEDFSADRKTRSATIRELEIIGEAASRISAVIKERHDDIPWRLLKDFRNVLSHEYFGVNDEVIWNIVQTKLPDLICKIGVIITLETEATKTVLL